MLETREPIRRTLAMLWLWAHRYGDGEARDMAEGELRRLGVSPLRGTGMMGSDT